MQFTSLPSVLRRRWRSALAMFLLVVGLNAAATFAQKPVYVSDSAVALLFVSNSPPPYAELVCNSYARMIGSPTMAKDVIAKLGLDMSPQALADAIAATVVPNSTNIEIVVKDDEPRVAQLINLETTRQLADAVARFQSPLGGSQAAAGIEVTRQPSLPAAPVSPRVNVNLLFGGLIGLLVAIATAAVREVLDRGLRTADQLAEITGAPVLAMVGFDRGLQKPRLGDEDAPTSQSQVFALLRTNLQFSDLDRRPRCLLVTSALPAEGKTVVSTSLAKAFARTGRRTVIIDADLRKPRVAPALGLDSVVGLTSVLIGRTSLEEAIQVHGPSGLHVLASGPEPPNPAEILQSSRTRDVIARLRQSYDVVIIDAPPALPVADPSVLSGIADGTMLVVRHGMTTADQVTAAVERVRQADGLVLGVVLNMIPKRDLRSANAYDSTYNYGETFTRAPGRDRGTRRR